MFFFSIRFFCFLNYKHVLISVAAKIIMGKAFSLITFLFKDAKIKLLNHIHYEALLKAG